MPFISTIFFLSYRNLLQHKISEKKPLSICFISVFYLLVTFFFHRMGFIVCIISPTLKINIASLKWYIQFSSVRFGYAQFINSVTHNIRDSFSDRVCVVEWNLVCLGLCAIWFHVCSWTGFWSIEFFERISRSLIVLNLSFACNCCCLNGTKCYCYAMETILKMYTAREREM